MEPSTMDPRRCPDTGREANFRAQQASLPTYDLSAVSAANAPDGATAPDHDRINAIRALSMDAVQQAESGHPGTPMALAPLGWLLFTRHIRHNPGDPAWPDRDRFVLSAGHASMF